jgi:hypothetical protein
MNKVVATVVIILASVGIFVVPLPTFAHVVSYFAGGLGAGVGASIVQSRLPLPVWKGAVVCLCVAYVPCVVVMLFGFPPAHALAYALVPTVLYGSAAIIFTTSS